MEGPRHGDRHVDAHHAGPHPADKGLRRIAVAGEERGAVAELMGVDEAKRLVEALGAHDREHRPEYLLAVDAHLGRHLVEQRAADEEALLIALDVEPASVDHQRSEEHTSELQSLMRISYAVFCLTKQKHK